MRPASGRAAARALVLAALLPFAAGAGPEADPFRTRNLSPVIAIFGLPGWETARPAGRREIGLTTEAASHFWREQRRDQAVFADGETWRGGLFYRQSFEGDWSVSAELPYYRLSGGVLDRVIDRWHAIFGLPDGARGEYAAGELLLRFEDAGGVFLELDAAQRGIGDFRVGIGRSLGTDRSFLLGAAVKLSSGREAMLAGSGARDWSVTMTRAVRGSFRDRAAAYYWGVGAVFTGTPALIRYQHEQIVYAAMLGGGWQFGSRIGVKAQLDLHSPVYRSALAHGGSGIQGTIGGWWLFTANGVLEFAVNEDLAVNTSPDLVLHTALRWKF